MYDRAIAMKDKTEDNITNCYRTAIIDYVKTSDTTDFYKTLINSVHYYTRISTVYSDISFANCINLYTSLFVPDVYIRSLSDKQKHDVLSMILRESIKSFSDNLLSNYLILIIDEHQDQTNVSILQDAILKELISRRDISYSKFVKCETKAAKKKPTKTLTSVIKSSGQKYNKLKQVYNQTAKSRESYKNKYNELQGKYKTLVEQCKGLQSMLLTQIKKYKDLAETSQEDISIIKNSEVTLTNKPVESIFNTTDKSLVHSESEENDDGLFTVQYS